MDHEFEVSFDLSISESTRRFRRALTSTFPSLKIAQLPDPPNTPEGGHDQGHFNEMGWRERLETTEGFVRFVLSPLALFVPSLC